MRVLGIETSCDETGVAVYDENHGIIVNELLSQIDLHARYGGVVPELASRDHSQHLLPLIDKALQHLDQPNIDAIAYTQGPGLMGALLVGCAVARSLAYAWGIPAIGVHHMEGHLLAPLLDNPKIQFPFVALLVSGGHTQLFYAEKLGCYQLLGDTLDDAAGEAFDKTATLLGLGYPGGPALAALASNGDPNAYPFPRPMCDRPGLDFSFSGLKTHALNTIKKHANFEDILQTPEAIRSNIASSFEQAVVDTLLIKCKRALQQTGANQLVIAGGVSANVKLRDALHRFAKKQQIKVYFPPTHLATDNGAMIAYAGFLRLKRGESSGTNFTPRPRWKLIEL